MRGEQWARREWKKDIRSRKARPEESIRRDGTGRVELKGVDQIIQRRLEDREESNTRQRDADYGGDPRILRVGGPTRDEQSRAEGHGAEHHGRQTQFGRDFAGGLFVVDDLVVDVDGGADAGADEEGEEGQRGSNVRPAPVLGEDDWDRSYIHIRPGMLLLYSRVQYGFDGHRARGWGCEPSCIYRMP